MENTYEEIKAKVENTKKFEEGRGHSCEVIENASMLSTFQQEKGKTRGTKFAYIVSFVEGKDNKRKAYGFTKDGFRIHRWAVPVVSITKTTTLVETL